MGSAILLPMQTSGLVLQWAGMATAAWGAWWLSADDRQHRRLGFSVLLGSNALWLVWGIAQACWGLVALQVVLAAFNGRGLWRGTAAQKQQMAALLDSPSASGTTPRGGGPWPEDAAQGNTGGREPPRF